MKDGARGAGKGDENCMQNDTACDAARELETREARVVLQSGERKQMKVRAKQNKNICQR